jgi:hypothetical protein
MTMRTAAEAMQTWRTGNDANEGFAAAPWFTNRAATVEEAVDEALDEPGSLLRHDLSGDGIQVVQYADGSLVGICDTEGAWAVNLSKVAS